MIAAVIPAVPFNGTSTAADAPRGAAGDAPAFADLLKTAAPGGRQPAIAGGKALPAGEGDPVQVQPKRDDDAAPDPGPAVADAEDEVDPALLLCGLPIAPPPPVTSPAPTFAASHPVTGIQPAADTSPGLPVVQGFAAPDGSLVTPAPITAARPSSDQPAPATLHPQLRPLADLAAAPPGSDGMASGPGRAEDLQASARAITPPLPAARTDAAVQPPVAGAVAPPQRSRADPLPRLVTGRALRERAVDFAPAALTQTAAPAGTAMLPVQPPVDTRDAAWPAAMISRIEALRDAADAVDTSIRVLPDALGAIDVSVRKDGEVTHVHLAAEQAQTARLLADAQPKLAELAEARGLRLATSTGGGGSGAGEHAQPQPQPQPRAPAAPPSSRRERASAPDQRIA